MKYEIEMLFSVDYSLNLLNSVADLFPGQPRLCAEDAAHISIKGTFTHIPEEETLKKVCRTIKEELNKSSKDVTAENVTFIGYKKITSIVDETERKTKNET